MMEILKKKKKQYWLTSNDLFIKTLEKMHNFGLRDKYLMMMFHNDGIYFICCDTGHQLGWLKPYFKKWEKLTVKVQLVEDFRQLVQLTVGRSLASLCYMQWGLWIVPCFENRVPHWHEKVMNWIFHEINPIWSSLMFQGVLPKCHRDPQCSTHSMDHIWCIGEVCQPPGTTWSDPRVFRDQENPLDVLMISWEMLYPILHVQYVHDYQG